MNRRDNFSATTVRNIAQRAGYRCSNPGCLRPTIGPDGGESSANIGVAAHITAASEGGPRFDGDLTPAERSDAQNGIWLCQTCSRLIDVDPASHSEESLREWKTIAEMRAYLGIRGLAVVFARSFGKLELKMPELVSEMRTDLDEQPILRIALVRHRKLLYNGASEPCFIYYYDDHELMDSKLRIMSNYGAIIDTSYKDVKRFEITEDFVEYLELPK